MNRVAILVLGMHRSGTSALTWLLGRLGAALPVDAIAATDDNARGFWESEALVKADDQLLRVARSSWFDPRPLDLSRLSADGLASRKARIRAAIEEGWGDASLLAIKDPRQCRCVPVIADVLREMRVEPRALLMLRHPAEIARSLASRDGTTPAYAHLLWLRHMIDAERATRGMMRATVDYDGLLEDWRATARRIAPLIGRDDRQPGADEAAAIDAFLDPHLRHYWQDAADLLEPPLSDIVRRVSDGLLALIDADDDKARVHLDDAYRELDSRSWLPDDIIHDELRHRRLPSPLQGRGLGEGASDSEQDLPSTTASLSVSPLSPPLSPEEERELAVSSPDEAQLIRDSGLFDRDYYLTRYPDAATSGIDPIDHYLTVGAAQGYNPNPLFDTGYYARQMVRRAATGQ